MCDACCAGPLHGAPARRRIQIGETANDEQFYADRYASLRQPAKPDLTVELVPGLNHVDMLMEPPALAVMRRTFDAMPR
jgi:hypothetical protein